MPNPPKPTALKVLQGNPGKRALPSNEPKAPALDDLSAPEELIGTGRAEWLRVAPVLDRAGLLTEVDRSALIAYCEQWHVYREAMTSVRNDGAVLFKIDTKGREYVAANPAAGIAREALKAITSLMREFGMTPSSRSRMSLPGEGSETGADDGILSA